MNVDLNDEERVALIRVLTGEIASSRYPMSPRIVMLKRIRAKLHGEEPAPWDRAWSRPSAAVSLINEAAARGAL